MSQNLRYPRHIVTAVLVAHDGARWLPETLQALLGQSRPVQRIVAVDNDSRDRGGALLAEALGAGNVLTLPRTTGYGAAIAEALRHPAADIPVDGPARAAGTGPVEWVWLIHDDSAPAPDALEQLLRVADDNQFATVLGPKVRDWHDHRQLVEVGVTIDGAGRRETGLEPRELDQGQHDTIREVLAVGSAGMLVRRDVWEQLGGFDPDLPLFRDDIDFCWRANAAGHKVLVVPGAVLYHAEASARRRRRIAATSDHPRRVDRRNALYVLFANLPLGALLVALVRNVFGSLLRTLLFLLAKQPANAWDELAALFYVFGNPNRLRRARLRRSRNRARTYSAIRPYMARGVAMSRLADMVSSFLSGSGPVESSGRHHAVGGSDEEDEETLLADAGLLQRALTNPGVLLCLGLAVVTLIAERSLIGGGRLGGGALTPVWGGASDLWREYLSGWHDTGLGSAASAPPYVAVLALLATVLFGKTWLAVSVLLLGCVPIAGIGAYLTARRVVPYAPAQLWMAASYALLPVATGAVAAGRIGTAVVFALIPFIGILATRMLAPSRRVARRAAWGVGLLLTVATAFVPLVWLLAVLAVGLVAVAFATTRRFGMLLGIAVLTPPVLLLPWMVRLFAHPSLFVLEAGLHRPELSSPRLSATSLLLLSPGGPGMPPVWVTAGFLVAGLAALCLRRQRVVIAAGWGVAVFGVLVAILVSRVTVEPPTGGPAASAWPGVALAFASIGVLVAAATAGQTLTELRRRGGLIKIAATAVAVIACSMPVLSALTWVVRGVPGPLSRHNGDVLPAFVVASSTNGAWARTLVLRPQPDGTVAYTVLRGRDPLLGEAELTAPANVADRLNQVVSGLASGRGGDEGTVLADFDIRYVLLPNPGRQQLVSVLDGVPGMSRVSMTPDFALWRVTAPTARLRILDDAGSVVPVTSGRVEAHGAVVPPGPPGRTLVLAEPADGGWQASLNGRQLPAKTVDGWAQGFVLPPSGGRLDLTRGMFLHHLAVFLQGLAALVVVVFALPGGGAEETEDEQAPGKPRGRKRGRAAPRRARGHRARRAAPTAPAAGDTGDGTPGPAASVDPAASTTSTRAGGTR